MRIRWGGNWVVGIVGVLPFLAASVLLWRSQAERPVRDLQAAGLHLRFEQARWTRDEMAHPRNARMPPQMAPDFPAPGAHRLAVEFSIFNGSAKPLAFDPAELVLRSEDGARAPFRATVPPLQIAAGQSLTAVSSFDAQEGSAPLTLYWERGGVRQRILSTAPPATARLDVGPVWPERAEELPPGDPAEGRALYFGPLACFSCHGDPAVPRSNTVGPEMAGIANAARERASGRSAAQYLYEAVLDPDAAIAPTCVGDQPCPSPSTMPFYGDRLSLQDAAHLVSFLLTQTRPAAAEERP